jgi:hypothetical protein
MLDVSDDTTNVTDDARIVWLSPSLVIDTGARGVQITFSTRGAFSADIDAYWAWRRYDRALVAPMNIVEEYQRVCGVYLTDDSDDIIKRALVRVFNRETATAPRTPFDDFVERNCMRMRLWDALVELHDEMDDTLAALRYTMQPMQGIGVHTVKGLYDVELSIHAESRNETFRGTEYTALWVNISEIVVRGMQPWVRAYDVPCRDDTGDAVVSISAAAADDDVVELAIIQAPINRVAVGGSTGLCDYNTASVTIDKLSGEDKASMLPCQWATDRVVAFLIANQIKNTTQLEDGDMSDVYVFTSFFLEMLASRGHDPTCRDSQSFFRTRLIKWATVKDCAPASPGSDDTSCERGVRKSVLLEKDFILIPANFENLHWFLSVVYRPYDKDVGADVPLLYAIDSKIGFVPRAFHESRLRMIKEYLSLVIDTYSPNSGVRLNAARRYIDASVPPQYDAFNCGFFIAHYFQALLESKDRRETIIRRIAQRKSVMSSITSDFVEEQRENACKELGLMSGPPTWELPPADRFRRPWNVRQSSHV